MLTVLLSLTRALGTVIYTGILSLLPLFLDNISLFEGTVSLAPTLLSYFQSVTVL